MRNNTTFVGNIGENIATDYLTGKGYRVIGRNVKICGCEIDIICEAYYDALGNIIRQKKDRFKFLRRIFKRSFEREPKGERTIVFCEVKSRSDDALGSGAEAVTPYKMGRYVTAGKAYMASRDRVNTNLRFDVVEVGVDGIYHIENAFDSNDAKYPKNRR